MFRFLLPFFMSFASLAQYSATSTHFSVSPTNRSSSVQLTLGLGLDSQRSQEIQGNVIYQSPIGIQAGIGFHGGLTRKPVFGEIGFDLMLGYMLEQENSFFYGLRTQAGVTYTGIGDQSVEPEFAFAIPVVIESTFGGKIANGTLLHISPGIELGHTMKGGDVVWKSGIGYRVTVGAGIPFTEATLMRVDLSPTLAEGEFLLKGSLQINWNF